MNRALFVLVFASCAWTMPSSGAAQYVLTAPSPYAAPASYVSQQTYDAEQALEIDWVEERARAGYLFDVGLGLTIGGLATAGLGGSLFGIGGNGWWQYIVGGLFSGIGSGLVLAGIPVWIVGGVRAAIADAGDDARARVAHAWRDAGTTIFCIGMALAAAGGIMMGVNGYRDGTVTTTAGVFLPVGVFLAAFIGSPMWAEGARF